MKILKTRAEAVAAQLRDEIRGHVIKPGTPLRQNDIAERFGVSTTPVREAFQILVREGLVTHDAHRGVVVFRPSPQALRENYEMRTALEPLATGIAAREMTKDDLDGIRGALDLMREAVVAGDVARYGTEYNPYFHEMIYRAAHRPRLAELIANLREAAQAYLVALAGRQTPTDLDVVQREHEVIFDALERRDADAAAAAMRSHLTHNAEAMLEMVAEYEQAGPTRKTPPAEPDDVEEQTELREPA